MTDVDLTQLAVDRSDHKLPGRNRRHLLTRYVLPVSMLVSLLALLGWTARDVVFPPQPVTVVPVLATYVQGRPEGTPLFQAAGWIEPRPTMVRVAALAPGVVEKLLVVEDQAVRAGEPVAELIKADTELAQQRALADRKLRQAELEEALATLTAAVTRLQQPVHLQAELGQADAPLAEVETELARLPFELRRAQAQLEYAQKNYDGKVAAGGAVSGRSLDAAKSQVETAKTLVEELAGRGNSLNRQRAALVLRRDALEKQLEMLAEEIQARDEAKAGVKAAEARLEQANVRVAEVRLQLDRMTIRAPIDGRVFQMIGHPGTRLSSGVSHNTTHDSSTVVTMYCPDKLQVRVDVRFEDIPKVGLSQPVLINNPALSAPLTGSVLFVGSEADIQKNTLEVKVAIASPPSVFKPGMLVDVTFLALPRSDQTENVTKELRLFLPQQLVQQQDGETFIWLADQSRQVARRTVVETGMIDTDGLVEITAGLTISSRVIHGGSDALRDHQRIRITGEDPRIDVRPAVPTGPAAVGNPHQVSTGGAE